MIENLSIKGFRGIEALEVPRCGQINVVVGRNGSGKTRLLEAAFALMFRANAEVFPSLAKLRGVSQELPARLIADNYRDSFATRGQQEARVAGHIAGTRRENVLRSLPGELAELSVPGGGSVGHGASATALAVFEIQTHESAMSTSHGHQGYMLSDGRWWVPRASPLVAGAGFLLRTPKRSISSSRLAQQWTAVEEQGAPMREMIVDALRSVDPGVHGLRLVALESGVAQLRVDYRELGLCPVELLGDGVVEAIHYLTMLVQSQGGVVLVDEFGTALDARNLDIVVRTFVATAKALDVQLFLSTHSLEVVDALLADSPTDHVLVMQMKSDAGAVSVETLDHGEARSLRDDLGFDLRRVA